VADSVAVEIVAGLRAEVAVLVHCLSLFRGLAGGSFSL
jgi:hypothetical protein